MTLISELGPTHSTDKCLVQDNMTSLRAFRPQDLFRANLTNLDPLTENYNIDYYLHYLTQWPFLFTAAEDQYDRIVGYSMRSLTWLVSILYNHLLTEYK